MDENKEVDSTRKKLTSKVCFQCLGSGGVWILHHRISFLLGYKILVSNHLSSFDFKTEPSPCIRILHQMVRTHRAWKMVSLYPPFPPKHGPKRKMMRQGRQVLLKRLPTRYLENSRGRWRALLVKNLGSGIQKSKRLLKEKKTLFQKMTKSTMHRGLEKYMVDKKISEKCVCMAKNDAYHNLYMQLGIKVGKKGTCKLA